MTTLKTKKIYLGIDPGFADMGYGLVLVDGAKESCLACGSIQTEKGLPLPQRLRRVYDELKELIGKHQPDAAAIEKLFFSKNVKTALDVAEARGVIRLCLEQCGVPCREFSPADVKIAVCGFGGADKRQVQQMTKTLLKLKEVPQPDDAADGLALAIAAAHTR